MSNTGETLINAIVSNNYLMAINNCHGIPAQMSRAVYGKTQDDSGAGTAIENNRDMQKNINIALGFSGANSETAVWHFMIGPPVHHFVVIHSTSIRRRTDGSTPYLWPTRTGIRLVAMFSIRRRRLLR